MGAWRADGGRISCAHHLFVICFVFTVYGFPGSDGSAQDNYFHFVKNRHPFLSIFFAHPLHPLSFRDRVTVFLCSLGFAFFVSVVRWSSPHGQVCSGAHRCLLSSLLMVGQVVLSDNKEKQHTCEAGCSRRVIDVNGQELCYGGYNDGISIRKFNTLMQPRVTTLIQFLSLSLCCNMLTTDEYNSSCHYMHPYIVAAICAAIITPYGFLLKFLGERSSGFF